MTHYASAIWEIRTELPASLRAVEEFVTEFRVKCPAIDNRADCFAVELLVREALTNAVLHGSGSDAAKTIRCCLRMRGHLFLITVTDDGGGFDWRAARTNASVLTNCSGRGMEILREYADHVRYNGRGNAVAMMKRLHSEGRQA